MMAASGAGRILLEVAVASAEDAVAAARGGADRLELNAALGLGGLTPSLGCLVEARQATRLPIWAMVRPRPGGFAYSDADLRTSSATPTICWSAGRKASPSVY
jgi:copper homeostasis protein